MTRGPQGPWKETLLQARLKLATRHLLFQELPWAAHPSAREAEARPLPFISSLQSLYRHPAAASCPRGVMAHPRHAPGAPLSLWPSHLHPLRGCRASSQPCAPATLPGPQPCPACPARALATSCLAGEPNPTALLIQFVLVHVTAKDKVADISVQR